ncbi:helix-turn-helix transcriptional regulator [Steroidobacter cummioxidans]|uniref:helix-turn-helix transcriptional regulator n=1 Tax=Steroidobacter cummioxidans TaxID=1803913 RepID=UPI000E316C4B|nr:helix-turn-helix transcriptional regulator [Steroidobacter cummioxidans]
MNTLRAESRAYFRELGKSIEKLRKSQQMTQAELARAVGVTPQAIYAYEIGDRRPSVLIVAKLAKALAVTVEELTGLRCTVPTRKGRLSPRAARLAERLQALPTTQRRLVFRIVTSLEDSNTANQTDA